MTKTFTSTTEDLGHVPSTNGSGKPDPLPLAPSRAMRSKVPQALLAALLIVGGGLGGLLLFNNYNQRTAAVVVTRPVAHGQALAREDLAITEVALDGGVATIPAISDAVGRLAAHDLQPGELVTGSDLATQDELVTAGESVIGLLLEAGQYPTKRIVAGDRVDVFAPGAEEPATAPIAANLVIFDVVESSSDGRTLLVSVVVTADQAAAVFEADEDGIRLSLRGQE